MTEITQIRNIISRELGPLGVLQRIESPLTGKGIPDICYCLRGRTGWLECKMAPASGRCPGTFTREQLMWGEEWVAAGGQWHLLVLAVVRWALLDAPGARRWFDAGEGCRDHALLSAEGKFPKRDVLWILTGGPI